MIKTFTVFFFLLCSVEVYSFGAFPGACGTMCVNNRAYYGSPYGGMPVYPYGGMPYHSMMGPSPYYFRPYGPSPYQPPNCVQCMMRYQQFYSPYQGMQGMPITQITIPFKRGSHI